MKFLTNLFSAFGKTKKNKLKGKSKKTRQVKKSRRNMHKMRGG